MGVLNGVEIVEVTAQFWGKCGASHCNQFELCGVVILCRGWLRGSPQISLGFLVIVIDVPILIYGNTSPIFPNVKIVTFFHMIDAFVNNPRYYIHFYLPNW